MYRLANNFGVKYSCFPAYQTATATRLRNLLLFQLDIKYTIVHELSTQEPVIWSILNSYIISRAAKQDGYDLLCGLLYRRLRDRSDFVGTKGFGILISTLRPDLWPCRDCQIPVQRFISESENQASPSVPADMTSLMFFARE